jgi:hypothetical protein
VLGLSGRPRKQQQPGPEDEPALDMDDVMYGTEELEGEEGLQVGGIDNCCGINMITCMLLYP